MTCVQCGARSDSDVCESCRFDYDERERINEEPADHDREWATLDCPTCEGTGEIQWNPSATGDPACVEDDRCPDCGGTGVAETRERSAA